MDWICGCGLNKGPIPRGSLTDRTNLIWSVPRLFSVFTRTIIFVRRTLSLEDSTQSVDPKSGRRSYFFIRYLPCDIYRFGVVPSRLQILVRVSLWSSGLIFSLCCVSGIQMIEVVGKGEEWGKREQVEAISSIL